MQKLYYTYDEVNYFHPIVESVLKNVIQNLGYGNILQVEHHPQIPSSSLVPDFAIKIKNSQKYIFILEVKRTNRDVNSQRYQNQTKTYVTELQDYWDSSYHKYFCVTNIEELILFADRSGSLSSCALKNNLTKHTPFDPISHNATQTIAEFEKNIEKILRDIFAKQQPDWTNNWIPIVDQFKQNQASIEQELYTNNSFPIEVSQNVSLYELFRLLNYEYLKQSYSLTKHNNTSYFKTFPKNSQSKINQFVASLQNIYQQILQLDFKQIFSNYPDANYSLFPNNISLPIANYLENLIRILIQYGKLAVSENSSPSYIFSLLTSEIYDRDKMHEGMIMSDAELSNLLATLTIFNHENKILDPCCGNGALLDAAYDRVNDLATSQGLFKQHNDILCQVNGIEIDPFLAQLATFRLISKNLYNVNQQTQVFMDIADTFTLPKPNSYDVILMNPPFLINKDLSRNRKQYMIKEIQTVKVNCFVANARQPNLYFYFVNYCWHYLAEKGKAGIILMAKFLNNKDGRFLKQFLLDKLEAVITYPRNYFKDFKVTTVIVIISKTDQSNKDIKFLNIKEESLLENPKDILDILSQTQTYITGDYTLKLTNRNISPNDNWRLYLIDPEDKYQQLNKSNLLVSICDFFSVDRGKAGNRGGTNFIFPNDFTQIHFSNLINSQYVSFGIKNSKQNRQYILSTNDLQCEQAVHFPSLFNRSTQNGLPASLLTNSDLLNLYNCGLQKFGINKFIDIVNDGFNSRVSFDILIPRNLRKKHACYYNPFNSNNNFPIVLSTNFVYLSNFKNYKQSIDIEIQKKFITAYLLSSFGQLQHELPNEQEGTRKLELGQIKEFKVLDLRIIKDRYIYQVVDEFDRLNISNPSFLGNEPEPMNPRNNLDFLIGKIIFRHSRLGFKNIKDLVSFFRSFLLDLIELRNP